VFCYQVLLKQGLQGITGEKGMTGEKGELFTGLLI
jgi:hypothetical protein